MAPQFHCHLIWPDIDIFLDTKNFKLWYIFFFHYFRSMNGSLPRPDLHLPLPNSETDPDSWSCSRSRDTSPESSIPPGMPSFRVIPLTCESDVGVPCGPDSHESPYVMRGSEPPDWETEPLQNRAGSVQPSSTMLRKNQYWVSIFHFLK